MDRVVEPDATDIAFDVTPGTTRILLRSKPSSDSLAVYSVEIHRKSGISFSTSDCSAASGNVSRTGPGASSVTCTPARLSSPRSDSLNELTKALVAAYVALLGIGEFPAAEPEIRMPPASRSTMPGNT